MRVYFAGPLFTPYERSFIAGCADRLRAAGMEVFVPHEELVAGAGTTAETVFAIDYAGVVNANAVIALLDVPVIDDGTACEIGLFYGLMQHDRQRRESSGSSPTFARRAITTRVPATASTCSYLAASRRRGR